MKIGSFFKTSVERKRYAVDYSSWLGVGETLVSVTFGVTPSTGVPIVVDANSFTTGNTVLVFFVSFGDNSVTYSLDIQITTSAGQVKEDTILFTIKNA